MITVRCVLKDEQYYSVFDNEFVEKAGMVKVGEGQYEGEDGTLNTSYKAIKRILKDPTLVNAIGEFTRIALEEEEDIMAFYERLKARGKI